MEEDYELYESPEAPKQFLSVCEAVLRGGDSFAVIDLEAMAQTLGGEWLNDYERAVNLHRITQRKDA